MAIPTTQLDLTSPAGGQDISLGDNRIREAKTQFQEIINADHDCPVDAFSDTVGQHKQVTLQEQTDIGTGAVGTTILGSQTINGKGELVYTDEDDNDIQITSDGALYMTSILNVVYPVGSIYANYYTADNPSTYLGIGTWVAIEEEVIAGYKSGGTFGTIGSLAIGEETHLLTGGESGTSAHTHPYLRNNTAASSGSQAGGDGDQTMTTQATTASTEADADDAHNNIQPTYVAYLWRRTI